MSKVKKINEFFGGDQAEDEKLYKEFEIAGLTKEDINKIGNYAYDISNLFDNCNKHAGMKKHTIPLVKGVKEIQEKYKSILDKLANLNDILVAPKTKY